MKSSYTRDFQVNKFYHWVAHSEKGAKEHDILQIKLLRLVAIFSRIYFTGHGGGAWHGGGALAFPFIPLRYCVFKEGRFHHFQLNMSCHKSKSS